MEVKVWVDGLQRVVCGAGWDTTCQDVVIALAHAMGRTGRFTLLEKWRDSERPLTPAQCPLRVLHKWGEYAAEVRFVLCQAGASDRLTAPSRDRLAKKSVEKSVSMHRIVSPQSQGAEASVKRSLTFSGGAHNQTTDDPASSMPTTSKFRKTQQGPVPNGDLRQQVDDYPLHSSTQVRRVKAVGASGNPLSPTSASDHPHQRLPSPAPPQQGGDDPIPSDPSPSLSSVLGHHLGDANRPSAFQPPKSLRSHGVSPAKASPEEQSHQQSSPSHLQPQPGSQPQSRAGSQPASPSRSSEGHPQVGPHPHSPQEPSQQQDEAAPPSPQGPQDYVPHSAVSQSPPSPVPSSHGDEHPSNIYQNIPDPTPVLPDPAPQIEEYDLDHNFPGSHRDWNHNEAPPDSLEYRLEEGLGSGSGSGSQPEGEHAKLLRLVNMQQQRLKTQESQISMVNTEISNLEETEMEYEENLHVIMEELLLQENRQCELEPQLNELDQVDWDSAAEEEQRCEIDLTLQVASCKAAILEKEENLEEIREQEGDLLTELQQEEKAISEERERLKQEEARVREEGEKTQEEISSLQTQFTELRRQSAECETFLASVESQLTAVGQDLTDKDDVLQGLEAHLKEENLREFGSQPTAQVDASAKDSQKVLRQILEGSLSPRLAVGCHNEGADKPLGPALLASFATSNQSGVWV
ncbi:hypothetical protein ACOMHN_026453 [Nucella lapillus]